MSVTDAYETDSQRNRNLRFRTYATRLMILAWGIEGIAVAIGLAIASSRVADANMMEGSDLNIWGMVQVSGGFIFHLMDRNHRLRAGPLQRICH